MTFKMKLISVIFLSIAINGCGGGGSSDNTVSTKPSTPTPTPTTPSTSTIDDEFALWLTDVSNHVIIPSYLAMQTQATQLVSASNDFCALAAPSQSDLMVLQQSWAEFNESWQYAQWIKVGPIVEESRLFRIQLWPDSNDAVLRNVGNILLEPNNLTAEFIATQPVGAQGIPALEMLLFLSGEQSILVASDKEKRCQAVKAISENLLNISTELYQGWNESQGNYIAQVVSGSGDFTSKKDAVEELVTNWLEQIEKVKDEKILKPVGGSAPGIPSIIEFTKSDQSLISIKANLRSFKDLFTAKNGYGFDDVLATFLDQKIIADLMLEKLDAAITTADTLEGNYVDLLNKESARQTLIALIQNVREIRDLVTTEFVQATDINIGFNSNDGD